MPRSSWTSVLSVLAATAMLVPLRSAERELVLRQRIPASESSTAACSGSLSGDGRFVAFVSMAALLPADTGHSADVYVIDRESLTLTLETPSPSPSPGHGSSCHPRLSGDGRYLVFRSEAVDLVRGGVSRTPHIFVRDRLLGTTERVTPPDANHTSDAPVISDDGRVVAFESHATNLVPGSDANGVGRDVYVVRLDTNEMIRAGVHHDGRQPAGAVSHHSASLSGDGRFLAFASTTNLGPVRESGERASRDSAIYLRDLVNGNTSCLSCIAVLGKGSASHPHLSTDARFVVFAWQPKPGRPSVSPRRDIVLLDRTWNTTTVITRAANAASDRPRISGNGRYIAFESLASNLRCGKRCRSGTADENLLTDIYLFDRLSGAFTRLSGTPHESWGPSVGVSLDRDGRVVSFSSRQLLDINDATTDFDLFVRAFAGPR